MSEELLQLGVRREELGGSEGPENWPVASYHRGTGRQAPSVANEVSGSEELSVTPAQIITVTRQLVSIVGRLEARLAALEADKSDRVTILHADVNRLNKMIRQRADVIGARYELDTAGVRRIRAAIRKDVLKQYGIRDFHDLPAKRLQTCQLLISNWSSLAAVKAVIGCA